MTEEQMVDIMIAAEAEVTYGGIREMCKHILEAQIEAGMLPCSHKPQGTNGRIERNRWLIANGFTWEIYDV